MQESFRVEALSSSHDRSRFRSGAEALDHYFRNQASQDIRRNIATCFVAVTAGTPEIAGYYTLSATSIPLDQLPSEVSKKLPRYPVVPAALLGRLAIAREHQGKGLGAALLADAITRASRTELGIFAIVVDAKDDAARHFYEHHGFAALLGQAHRLMLPIATARRALEDRRR